MYKLEIRNKTAIYLDHRELIKNMYNNDIAVGMEMFELREEIFHFHDRGIDFEDRNAIKRSKTEEYKLAVKVRKSKKRKSENYTSTPELSNLQIIIEEFLHLMEQEKIFKPIENNEIEIFPRHWEEISSEDFPKFNGTNATDAYQRCKFGVHSFIIPPRCKFYNNNVDELTKLLPQLMPTSEFFDLIVLDPPWRNKYIRRLKRAKQELGYKMLNTVELSQMPIERLVHKQSILAIWCTNSQDHQRAIVEELLPKWNLRVLHIMHWVKVNTKGQLIGPIDTSGTKKQPFEMIYLACHLESGKDFGIELQKVTAIFSIPSIVHSHKPPLLPWLKNVLPDNPNCLEIFARYLQPQFTSIGLEVLKLMDERLYSSYKENLA
uniref:Methyltransferase-like protein 4 n=1 Tax=Ceratitis capitata TaxID=7213 RepID=W8BSG3_CERCA